MHDHNHSITNDTMTMKLPLCTVQTHLSRRPFRSPQKNVCVVLENLDELYNFTVKCVDFSVSRFHEPSFALYLLSAPCSCCTLYCIVLFLCVIDYWWMYKTSLLPLCIKSPEITFAIKGLVNKWCRTWANYVLSSSAILSYILFALTALRSVFPIVFYSLWFEHCFAGRPGFNQLSSVLSSMTIHKHLPYMFKSTFLYLLFFF